MQEQHHPFRNALIALFLVLIVVIGLFWWYTLTHPRTPSIVAENTPGYHFNPLDIGTPAQQNPLPDNPGVPREVPQTVQTPAPTNAPAPTPTQTAPAIINTSGSDFTSSGDWSSYVPPKSIPTQTTTQPSNSTLPIITYNGGYYTPPSQTDTNTGTATTTQRGSANSNNNTLRDILDYLQIFGTLTGNPVDTTKTIVDLTGGLSSGSPFGGTNNMLVGGSGGGGGGGGFGGGFGGGGGGGATQSFGTVTITNITECTCSGSRLLDMEDTNHQNLSLLVTPGTQVKDTAKSMYGIRTGMKALGTYTAGGVCEVIHGEECDQQGNPRGSIVQIGTSN